MLDILGREVSKGDIIVYGGTKGGQVRYADTRFGLVNNVLGQRTHLAGSSMYKKIFKELLADPVNAPYLPPSVDTVAKVTFYQINLSDKYLNTHITSNKTHPNGKPKRGIVLTTSFLKVNTEDLNGEWLEAYTEARKAFKV